MSSRRIYRIAVVLMLFGVNIFVSNHTLHAQASEEYAPAVPTYIRYGLFGGITVNNHLLYFNDFATFQSSLSPSRTGFVSANYGVVSYYVGGLIEYPLIERLGVSLRGSVTDIQSLSLVTSENFLLAPSGTTTPSAIQITHAVTFNNLQMLSGEPYLTYRIEGGLTLYAGARFGFMLNPTYSYKQTVTDDSPVKFVLPNGQTTGVWNAITNSPIPQANPVNTALSFGASLETPIDPQGHWFVAVEAFYMHGLTPVTNSLVLPRPIANYNGLPATRFVPVDELGANPDPRSQAWPSELDAGSWLLKNIRAGISLRYAP
jgi:hypothetical protein